MGCKIGNLNSELVQNEMIKDEFDSINLNDIASEPNQSEQSLYFKINQINYINLSSKQNSRLYSQSQITQVEINLDLQTNQTPNNNYFNLVKQSKSYSESESDKSLSIVEISDKFSFSQNSSLISSKNYISQGSHMFTYNSQFSQQSPVSIKNNVDIDFYRN